MNAEPGNWSSHKEIFRWLKIHSRPDAVVACWNDPMVYLYTGRRAIRPFKITPGLLGYGKGLETYRFGDGAITDLEGL